MRHLFWLSDDQWSAIEPLLPRNNAFCRLKDFRRVATRYDKLARNFLSAVTLATLVAFWL